MTSSVMTSPDQPFFLDLQPAEIHPSVRSEVLIPTENETEKDCWLLTLEELHKATKQNPNQMVGDQLLQLADFPDPFCKH